VPCGDEPVLVLANRGTALGVCGVSKRRAVCELRAWNSGEREVEETEARRALYEREWAEWLWAAAWKAVEGEGGAERVGEDEVSIALARGPPSVVEPGQQPMSFSSCRDSCPRSSYPV
jgi:hypothetical protein